jgi:DNA polymerase V
MNQHNKIFALVDVNNCYVSCERVFNPKLNEQPVIVLSNNDGCAVSRSQEAKEIGIKMGAPFFKIKDIVEQYNVKVLSSNYKLYAEMSKRFHSILGGYVSPHEQESYSIDEAFLDLTAYQQKFNLNDYAQHMRARILKWIGLPVCVGIGRSKTEAKIANHLAKTYKKFNGVCNLAYLDETTKNSLLQNIDVNEVWGIGRKNTERLKALGIQTAYDLKYSDPTYIRKLFNIVMARTVSELQGTSCLAIENQPPAKQQIISSKSFGHRVTDIYSLSEAMSDYLQSAVKRLRDDKSLCGCIIIFAESNPFDKNRPFFKKSINIGFDEPTDSSSLMNRAVLEKIHLLFKDGVEYKKCGIILTCLESKESFIPDLLSNLNTLEKNENIQSVLESVKEKYGDKFLAIGSSKLPNRSWKMSRDSLSQDYFSWDGLLVVDRF